MSADSLTFSYNLDKKVFEVDDDGVFYEFVNKNEAVEKLKEILGENNIKRSKNLKKIKFDFLKTFYKNYSTDFCFYSYDVKIKKSGKN